MRRGLFLLVLLASPIAAGTVPVVVSVNGAANAVPKFTLAGATLGASSITDDGSVATIPRMANTNVTITEPATPVIDSVTPQGTPGATTYGYKIVGKLANGANTMPSAEVTTATGNATLDGTNFNRIIWSAVAGIATYDVYRTTGGSSPPKRLIAGTALLTFDDTGMAGTAVAPPTTRTAALTLLSAAGHPRIRFSTNGTGADSGQIEFWFYTSPDATPIMTINGNSIAGVELSPLGYRSDGRHITSNYGIGLGWQIGSDSCYSFASGTAAYGTQDVALCRFGPQVMRLTNGTSATNNDGSIAGRSTQTVLVADAVVQYGQTVMPDAGTDGRFDINTGSATTALGVLAGIGPSAQGTAYGIVVSGLAHVTPSSGTAVTRGHFLCQSATAGVVDDSATLCTAGLTIGKALYSEATDVLVSATATSDEIVLTSAPGWAVGDPVAYYEAGGAAIAGLTSGNVYWIKTISSATVTLCATKGCGTAVNITADGTITTQYLIRLPQAVVHVQ